MDTALLEDLKDAAEEQGEAFKSFQTCYDDRLAGIETALARKPVGGMDNDRDTLRHKYFENWARGR